MTKSEIIIRDLGDIAIAQAAILSELEKETSVHKEVASLARMAYYHLAQTVLWRHYHERYEFLTSLVVCSYGNMSYPSVIITLKNGEKHEDQINQDYASYLDIEDVLVNLIQEVLLDHPEYDHK